jgi:hypothetical protein
MRAYMGSSGRAPLILNLNTTWKSVLSFTNRFTPREVAVGAQLKYKARWAPELVWTFGEDKNLSPMLDIKSHPVHSVVTILNELSLLLST